MSNNLRTYKDLETNIPTDKDLISELTNQVLALQKFSVWNMNELSPSEISHILESLYNKSPNKLENTLPSTLVTKIQSKIFETQTEVYVNKSGKVKAILSLLQKFPKEIRDLIVLNFIKLNTATQKVTEHKTQELF